MASKSKFKLSKEQEDEYRAAFALFDKDGGGTISTKELTSVMNSLGHNTTPEMIAEIIKEVDADGSGEIDFDEFVALMLDGKKSREEELKEAFEKFDADGNGVITLDELKLAMKSVGDELGDEEIQQMMKEADTDGNGSVDFAEFCKMMNAAEEEEEEE